jgi:hypothetical protein
MLTVLLQWSVAPVVANTDQLVFATTGTTPLIGFWMNKVVDSKHVNISLFGRFH